jgi:L-ascorbate metabolism protein UlaG (beta-lactamase superfamily)
VPNKLKKNKQHKKEVTMVDNLLSNITWLGHDAFRIDASKTVYFDPYQIAAGKPADLILITHDHFDHCSPEDAARIQGPDTVIVTEKDSAKKLSGSVKIVAPGDRITAAGIAVEAVPAYNTDKKFHPRANGWLGFIVEIDGVRIYHAGDTDVIPEMKNFKVDIALLPVSGTYVMTADQAVEAALMIKPKVVIPMHFGAIVGSDDDAVKLKSALKGKIDVRILPRQNG